MSEVSKWNARYASQPKPLPAPAEVLTGGAHWLDRHAGLCALDLACGRAANGQWLAERGYRVSAWDISDCVIDEIRRRQPPLIDDAVVRDVSAHPPEPDSFDVIVVCRFLDRAICAAIARALKPGGILFYQTFTHGLSNPDYLLRSNELPALFSDLHVLEYREPAPDESGKAEARLVARQDREISQ